VEAYYGISMEEHMEYVLFWIIVLDASKVEAGFALFSIHIRDNADDCQEPAGETSCLRRNA
jgi:hypothetical protein